LQKLEALYLWHLLKYLYNEAINSKVRETLTDDAFAPIALIGGKKGEVSDFREKRQLCGQKIAWAWRPLTQLIASDAEAKGNASPPTI